jgi:branched-chain amino acid transport system substrate-binding protein
MSKRLTAVLAVLVATAVAAVGASAAPAVDPGVTAKTIKLGGTFPLSGPVSSYAPIPVGMRVYFSYVNARRGADKKRGVGGRQIIWKYVDDQYTPAQTVQQTRSLVESDKVFALVGGLGTEAQESVRPYLNQTKVPQLFVSTGATEFGRDIAQYPWTLGWQPDYEAEGAVYGRAIATSSPNAKIGILFQNDSYGADYVKGFESGLGGRTSNIVSRQGVDATATSVASQIAALRATNPDVLAIFVTPTLTIRAYATMRALGFKPSSVYVNSVSATDAFMTAAVANSSADTVNGSISVSYAKDPANAKWDNDPAMKQYKALMAKYAPGARATDGLYLYGMAKAYDTVQLLTRLGKNPTRAALTRAAKNMNWVNPFLLPGVRVKTSSRDGFPISQMQLIRFNNGTWNETGSLIAGRGNL